MKDKKKVIQVVVVVFVLMACFFYLYSKGTYTFYESAVTGDVNPDIAKWNIKINQETITIPTSKNVNIRDISWTSTHTSNGKVAPGSKGVMNLSIDTVDTGVAIRYDIQVIDKKMDPLKILTVHSLKSSAGTIVQTGINTYTGLIPLDRIIRGELTNVQLDLEWINDDNINDFDTVIDEADDYLILSFKASQYRGEEIIPFSE